MAHAASPRSYHTASRLGLLLFALVSGALATLAAEDRGDWALVTHAGDVTVFERGHPGTPLREFKGVGPLSVPPMVAKRVLDDVAAYPHFMPYVVEAKLLTSDARTRISYQRISPPIVGDRDYTVRVLMESHPAPGGIAYLNRWETANALGPQEKAGVTRIQMTQGSWLLEPTGDGHQTQATYTVFTDPGGSIPSLILNQAGKTAVPKIFAAVRTQALLPKYAGDVH